MALASRVSRLGGRKGKILGYPRIFGPMACDVRPRPTYSLPYTVKRKKSTGRVERSRTNHSQVRRNTPRTYRRTYIPPIRTNVRSLSLEQSEVRAARHLDLRTISLIRTLWHFAHHLLMRPDTAHTDAQLDEPHRSELFLRLPSTRPYGQRSS